MTDISETLEEREKTHGDYAEVASTAQAIKTYIAEAAAGRLSATQHEALDMIASKIGRICSGNPNEPDHWRDIEGYARLVRERLE